MENTTIIPIAESIPAVIKNTHLNVTLEGWPAVVTAISICSSIVAIYAIKRYSSVQLAKRTDENA